MRNMKITEFPCTSDCINSIVILQKKKADVANIGCGIYQGYKESEGAFGIGNILDDFFKHRVQNPPIAVVFNLDR
jgi:hypothetical protein